MSHFIQETGHEICTTLHERGVEGAPKHMGWLEKLPWSRMNKMRH